MVKDFKKMKKKKVIYYGNFTTTTVNLMSLNLT